MAGVKFEEAAAYSSGTSDFIPVFDEIRFAHLHVCKCVHIDRRLSLSLDMFCHRYSSYCNLF